MTWPSPNEPVLNRTLNRLRHWWWLALCAALALVVWDASARAGRILSLSRSYGVAVNAPPVDAQSPTGFAGERRTLVLPALARDAQHWVVQTQAMVAAENARVRRADYDNAPAGREVHWSSAFRWWLLGCAHLDRQVTGTALPQAIERAVLWANPLLFTLLLCGLGPLVARRWGGTAAAVLVLGWVAAFPFAVSFYASNGDHHGAVQTCALLAVVLLAIGHLEPAPRVHRWFAASGIAGGIGLWISAATMIPVLIGIGLAAVAGAWLMRRQPGGQLPPWRTWAIAGGLTSLLAYGIEYAPGDFAWRLEVNHPLYALAWIGGGELMARTGQRLNHPRQRWTRREIRAGVAAAVALLAPPLAVLWFGARVFQLSDPFLQALHARSIAEFQSLARYFAGGVTEPLMIAQWLPVVIAFTFAGWLWRRLPEPVPRARLVLCLVPTLVILALATVQLRWWGLACALTGVLTAQGLALLPGTRGTVGRDRHWRVIVGCAIVPALLMAARAAEQAGTPTGSDVFRLAERDIAHRLRLRAGTDPLLVAAAPDVTTAMIYFADARGLGTLYWENRAGLVVAADLFAARTAEQAYEMAARRGVTHVLLCSWDESVDDYIRLARRLPANAPLPADAFAVALKQGRIPNWLRPLPHPLPPHPALQGHEVRLFEFAGDRAPDELAVHAAAYAVETGQTEAARALESELATYPDSLAAVAALAGLQARRRDEAGFTRSLARAEGLLAQAATLPLEDSIRVSMVLAIGGRSEQAAGVLRSALVRAEERSLRRLTPRTLSDLIALNEALGVTFPTEALGALAEELLPPK